MADDGGPRGPAARTRAVVLAALRDQPDAGGMLARICDAGVGLLHVDGASVSVMSVTDQREVMYASDAVVARIEALQFSLGEGPCFEAFHTRRPVLVPDLAAASTLAWPVFAEELIDQPVGAIFAFPLQSGAISIGALDLYRRAPGWLSPDELAIALEVVDLATVALLGLEFGTDDGDWLSLSQGRAQVHQATGMLIAALGVPADQALARLRAYAFGAGRMVDDVARDIVARRVAPADLDNGPPT
jgi:hypothetical protein